MANILTKLPINKKMSQKYHIYMYTRILTTEQFKKALKQTLFDIKFTRNWFC